MNYPQKLFCILLYSENMQNKTDLRVLMLLVWNTDLSAQHAPLDLGRI
jgi:hypothetical protein